MNPYWNLSFGSPLGGRIRSVLCVITNRMLSAIIATYGQESAVYPPEMPSGYFLPRQTQEICHEVDGFTWLSKAERARHSSLGEKDTAKLQCKAKNDSIDHSDLP